MNAKYLDEALKVIPEPQILVNVVSRRVRQLNSGSRPMIDAEIGAGLADIALQEIAAGKIGYAPQAKVEAA
jgi:DNA-directed RNA polymerase subunit omega